MVLDREGSSSILIKSDRVTSLKNEIILPWPPFPRASIIEMRTEQVSIASEGTLAMNLSDQMHSTCESSFDDDEEEAAALNSEGVSRSCQIAEDRATAVFDGWLAVSRMYCIPPMLAPDTGTWICTAPAPAPWQAPAGRLRIRGHTRTVNSPHFRTVSSPREA